MAVLKFLWKRTWVLTGLLLVAGVSPAQAAWEITLESGLVWQNRNDVQIPNNNEGTRFAIDEFNSGSFLHYRVEVYNKSLKNHGFRLLYAPFSVNVSGTPDEVIDFDGTTFQGGTETEFRYKFNSYRATWYYAFWGHAKSQLNLGFTAKVRDAETQLSQTGGLSESFDNLGFVPLVYFEYLASLSTNWFFRFQIDGLAGGPGRAFDASFKLGRILTNHSSFNIGYRTLEGGADTEDVFAFSWFNYAIFDYTIGF